MRYRKEIDGLRAIAVIPVVFFHSGLKLFQGGYVGVDVFFVISGYLITTVIFTEKEKKTFSIVNFYERRARRILPALFFMMLCCLPCAWLWIPPEHFKSFTKSLIAVPLFLSNILFLKESGYFYPASELKPLLHTWSLAVEEQYYLLFPLLLTLIWKLKKKVMVFILISISLSSLFAAHWGAYNDPDSAFYLLSTRLWEIIMGALVAIYLLYVEDEELKTYKNKTFKNVASIAGLALIACSVFWFDDSVPFPSFYALIPTVGTAIIIIFATEKTLVASFLSMRPIVFIGLISYSAYLWHQPLLAFAKHGGFLLDESLMPVIISILTIKMAYLTWLFIEKPFRNKQFIDRKRIFILALASSTFFISTGFLAYNKEDSRPHFTLKHSVSESLKNVNYVGEKTYETKILDKNTVFYTKSTEDIEDSSSICVFGDSHAWAMVPAFHSIQDKIGGTFVFNYNTGCVPLLGADVLTGKHVRGFCREATKAQYDYVVQNNIKDIFLVARWSLYTDDLSRNVVNGKKLYLVGYGSTNELTRESSQRAFELALRNTIESYKKIGTRVHILLQAPQQNIDAPTFYREAIPLEESQYNEFIYEKSVKRQEHNDVQRTNRIIFDKYKTELRLINLDNVYCDKDTCYIGTKDASYYTDTNHLSPTGAKLASDKIIKSFNSKAID